jgi:Legume lectin domain
MRFGSKYSSLIVVSALLLCLGGPAAAQQIFYYPDFSHQVSTTGDLQQNGSAHMATWQSQAVLRLTDGGSTPQAATAYFKAKQPVADGFTTWFEFQVHNPMPCCAPGDGLAFIVQNSTATEQLMGASGMGLTALGAGNGATGGGMGYAGINNSLAIEFDILRDPWDPNSNHIAVQSCATAFNTPVHLPGDYTIGNDHQVESCLVSGGITGSNPIPLLGGSCSGDSCSDGAIHQVVMEYTPPVGNSGSGRLQIWLDPPLIPGTHTPKRGTPATINIPYTITQLNLDTANCDPVVPCSAWVGFTASQPSDGAAQDILAWEFTPHARTKVTEVIQNGLIPTTFAFGGHKMVNTYPQGFINQDGILMTVEATPVDQITFYQQRLKGTPFANETCAIYLQTGGLCVIYSVTCQDPITLQDVPCPSEPGCSGDTCITIESTFTTSGLLTQSTTDFLEADPIGSNNWSTIFESYDPNKYDGAVSGKGSGFSDVVVTFRTGAP